ncbi:MAG TPA: threonine synthase [Thermoanaerobaculia bacterium]|jgi:threonine synthase|nr:threonine synthase [Thermoanaerobaculia bacterium]
MSEWLQCVGCERRFDASEIRYTCECGELLSVERDAMPDRSIFDARLASRKTIDKSGVWRFREAVLDLAEAEIVTHSEGSTRLYEREWGVGGGEWEKNPETSSHSPLPTPHSPFTILFKHEGENPTGSFKDRGMTVAMTQAKRLGARAVACASTGNTSASLAAYAAQAGLRAIVFIPAGKVATGKLAQTLAYGATALHIRGDFDAAMQLVREASDRLGIYLVNSINPFRIEGQKTIVWELLQDLEWNAPDWIVVPAGNLGNTSAFGKALAEAFDAGWIAKMPRLASIQAAGANPFYRSYRDAFAQRHRITAETIASAIRIGDPVSHRKAVAAIQRTNGIVEQVTDDELMLAKREIDEMGIGCEPASATTLAGVKKLRAAGVMRDAERVVCVLTGHLLKDTDAIMRNVPTERTIEIDATMDAVERALAN